MVTRYSIHARACAFYKKFAYISIIWQKSSFIMKTVIHKTAQINKSPATNSALTFPNFIICATICFSWSLFLGKLSQVNNVQNPLHSIAHIADFGADPKRD